LAFNKRVFRHQIKPSRNAPDSFYRMSLSSILK
jgi:hypothetical protein